MPSYLLGYLEAMAALNKNYNQYSCKTDLLLDVDINCEIDVIIAKIYKDIPLTPILHKREVVPDWLEIEKKLSEDFLLKEPFFDNISNDILTNRRKYLSFKITDIIEFIFNNSEIQKTYKVAVTFMENTSTCLCYLFCWKTNVLVLQFCES
ncbi:MULTISPECIES: hypothetical protein [unclassified Thiothrix]|nr:MULTISPECIES: hypothetical protein [unclassified Thiothrix]